MSGPANFAGASVNRNLEKADEDRTKKKKGEDRTKQGYGYEAPKKFFLRHFSSIERQGKSAVERLGLESQVFTVKASLMSATGVSEGLFSIKELPMAVISSPSDPTSTVTCTAVEVCYGVPRWDCNATFSIGQQPEGTKTRFSGKSASQPMLQVDLFASSKSKKHLGRADIPLESLLKCAGEQADGTFNLMKKTAFGGKERAGSVRVILIAKELLSE